LALWLAALAVIALGVTTAAAWLTVTYWSHRFPGGRWTQAEWSYFSAGWGSVLVAQLCGLWLWWRAPRSSVGRWLWLAGLSLSLWFIGVYWPSPWGMQLSWAVFLYRPALAMVFLGWPTGRPSRRVREWIVLWTALYVASILTVGLFARAATPRGWPTNPLAPFDVGWVQPVIGSATQWLFFLLPPAALIVILVRRRRRLPAGARHLLTPITVTGVIVAISDLVTAVLSLLASGLLFNDTTQQSTVLGAVNLAQNYAQLGVATIGIMLAFAYRERAVTSGDRHLTLDLGRIAPPMAASVAVRRLLDDPTARVLYPRPTNSWVDADGRETEPGLDHRTFTPVVGVDGAVLAAIETDGRLGVHTNLIEIGAASVASRLDNERAAALANARQTELRAMQITLLDAVDTSRRRLERDLHDGAQQRLVGLALAARLAARSADPAEGVGIRAEVARTRTELIEFLEDTVPAALTNGLASGLTTLAASTPFQTEVHAHGDLGPGDRLARTLWLIATEAVANVEKHADALSLRIELLVDPKRATLRVVDDGRGGLEVPPRAMTLRANEAHGTISAVSPKGEGTELVAVFDRTSSTVPV
jgi:signal transduction histidine kinase